MQTASRNAHASTVLRHILFALVALALATSGFLASVPFSSAAHAMSTVPPGWLSFTDPVYQFTISYPPSWTLERGYDGSHITLVDPQTGSTLSPLVSVDTRSPDAVLAQSRPTPTQQARDHATMTTLQISGHPALDVFFPFIAPTTPAPHNAGMAQAAQRGIVLPVTNTAGSTNIYAFQATFTTDNKGQMSAAVAADPPMVTNILATFQLPTQIAPAPTPPKGHNAITPNIGTTCMTICWADNNYLYTQYNDVSQLYCDMNGYNYNSTNGTFSCADGINNSAVEVPYSANNVTTYYQPYFQCAEFVSRALSQEADIPGLVNGGVNGSAPATPTWGNYSYGRFPMTYMGASYSSDTLFDLNDTGTDSLWGLYQYLRLSTTNSKSVTIYGTGVGLPETSFSQTAAGDVVFFYDNSSATLANLAHVMIVTSTQGTADTTLLDGHNADNYHISLSSVAAYFHGYYQILHMHHNIGSYGHPTSSGSWNYTTDGYNQSIQWAYTGCSSCNTAGAYFSYPSGYACAMAIYVPAGDATAGVYFGIYNTSGGSVLRYVNENAIDGWALLYRLGDLSSAYDKINVSNNTGTSGQQLGVGEEAFMC